MTERAAYRMTRKQAVGFLNERGFPITKYGLDHACKGDGPRPCAKWGRQYLYAPEELLRWAENHLKAICYPDANPKVAIGRSKQ
jgi:hypothetical protein